MALPTGTRLGPYVIADALDAGGMGEVYRAHDTRLGRIVAIKVLRAIAAADPESRLRFAREARAIASLNHSHICPLHDFGSQGEVDFLVMETGLHFSTRSRRVCISSRCALAAANCDR